MLKMMRGGREYLEVLTSLIGDISAGRPDQQGSLRALVSSPVSLWYEGGRHRLVVPPHPDLPLPLILAAL